MLVTSYCCRPLCRNLLGGCELLQLQLHGPKVYGLNLNIGVIVRLLALPSLKICELLSMGHEKNLTL
jgi:hypothetical protein